MFWRFFIPFLCAFLFLYFPWQFYYYRGRRQGRPGFILLRLFSILGIWFASGYVIYRVSGVSMWVLPDWLRVIVYVIDAGISACGLVLWYESSEIVSSVYRSFKGNKEDVNRKSIKYRLALYLFRLYLVGVILFGCFKGIIDVKRLVR